MKRTLNAELVRVWHGNPNAGWVFLRDPKSTSVGSEQGIGHEEIEVMPEPDADRAAFCQQLGETEAALSVLSGIPPEREPCVVLTKDCFGLEGPVRLLIYSDKPFA